MYMHMYMYMYMYVHMYVYMYMYLYMYMYMYMYMYIYACVLYILYGVCIWVVVKMLVPEIDVKSELPRCRLMS